MKAGLPVLILSLVMIFIAGGIASGQCVPDNNETSTTATPLGFTDTVTNWVCPDDKFDYYSITISSSSDVSGTIHFESPQTGTVLRFANSAGNIAEQATTDAAHSVDIPVGAGTLSAGIYYFRITYYSAYAFEHEYTLTLNLSVTKTVMQWKGMSAFSDRPSFIFLLASTWPSPRHDAMNRGQSGLSGPFGNAVVGNQFNIKNDLNLNLWPSLSCSDLLGGPSGRVYMVNHDLQSLLAYDLSTGFLWKFPISMGNNPFMLDATGNIYYLTGAGQNVGEKAVLNCMSSDAALKWSAALPGENNALSEIKGLGQKIYVSTTRQGDGFYVFAYNFDGTSAWTAGPLGNQVVGWAEDPDGYVYFHTWDGLYQYDIDGNYKWYAEFPKNEGGGFFTGAGQARGPIVGRDGRVWLNNTQRPQFIVYNRDGSIYRQVDYSPGPLSVPNQPAFVCLGSDDRLYIADTKNMVTCYSDWTILTTIQAWSKVIPATGGKILDMVMDKDNRLYLLYYTPSPSVSGKNDFRWISINPSDGATINDALISLPDGASKYDKSDFMIGDGGKLVYLNPSGILTVLTPGE